MLFFNERLRLHLGLLVVCSIAVFGESPDDDSVSVTLSNGTNIRGRLEQTLYAGQTFAAFKGIRYAEPPVGDLRFKAPVKKETYPENVDALEFGNICPHYGEEIGSEDCLFLNVYTPDVKPTQKLPVMVFLHGGGFYEGSGNDDFFGPDFLIEENVILVTLNYRIGVFGFLSLGTAEYSGNMGLKDQQLALRWVNENIEHFGGNPNKVTLFGHSAGAASTHLHVLAESSAGLFQRAIVMSGSAGNSWAFQEHSEQLLQMFALSRQHDSTINTFPALLKWLTEVPTAVLRDSIDPRLQTDTVESDLRLVYAPVIEKKWALHPFQQNHGALENYSSDVDVMFGYTSAEWIFVMQSKLADPSKLNPVDDEFNILLPWPEWSQYRESEEFSSMMEEVRNFYFGEDSTIDLDAVPELVALMTDIVFGYGIDQSVKIHASASTGNTFYYRFSADAKLNGFKILTNTTSLAGASHGDELCYIFKCNVIPGLYDLPASSIERTIQNNVLKLWTNFAKHGHPSPNAEPVDLRPVRPSEVHFVDIRNEGLFTAMGPQQKFFRFWDDLHAKYSKSFTKKEVREEL